MLARIAQVHVMERSLKAVHVLKQFVATHPRQSASLVN